MSFFLKLFIRFATQKYKKSTLTVILPWKILKDYIVITIVKKIKLN